jgi:predicted nucleic acid-binding protein
MAKKNSKIILIDADVVSHFIEGGEIHSLPNIFPNKIKVLDKVYAELERFPKKKTEIDNLLNFKILELEKFPENNQEIKREYFYIKNKLFKGS